MAARRTQPTRPAELSASDRLILFRGDRILLNAGEWFWPPGAAAVEAAEFSALLPVAEVGGCAYLTAELKSGEDFESSPLRAFMFGEADTNLELLSKASQLLNWYRTHRYCGICGAATALGENGRVLRCGKCARQLFPRINPCVIVLVTRGAEVLLARGARFRGGYYSCLAGFVEVGETPEQTVAREVREEVGVEVENVRYVESQSWPFPSQLMLGFLADYKAGEIAPDPDEIEDAQWFALSDLPPTPPANVTIAGRLIRARARHTGEAL